MRILGLDTATRATAVAVLDTDPDRVVECRDDPPTGVRPRHTEQLLSLAAAALAQADTDWAGIDRIAIGVGPGTFTGIRIGVASARALAASLAVPIVGVSTLHALAAGATASALSQGRAPLAVLDARRREVFVAGWAAQDAADPAAAPCLTPRAIAPDELVRALLEGSTSWLAVGDGALLCREALSDVAVVVPHDGDPCHRVSAAAVCRLARDLPGARPDDIRPEYLRLADAELTRRAAAGGRAS